MENIKTFKEVLEINVNDKTEKKNGLTYLSWAWAWQEFKKSYPQAKYTVKKNEKGQPFFYDENLGYMVFTEVEVSGLSYEMWLPVMDGANKAMKDKKYSYSTKYGDKEVEQATMFDINKTIMRCLTKNLAMFGLGLYIYAGEDLPEAESLANDDLLKRVFLEVDKIDTLDKLKEFYTNNKGLGKEFDEYVMKRKQELTKTK